MPFHYILANLLARADGAVGALFLDDRGETVDLACSDYSPYQMRVLGAYLGIYLRQVERMLGEADLGELGIIHIERDTLHIFAQLLPEGYYLVLVQRPPAMVGQARRCLAEASADMARELFPAETPAAP